MTALLVLSAIMSDRQVCVRTLLPHVMSVQCACIGSRASHQHGCFMYTIDLLQSAHSNT